MQWADNSSIENGVMSNSSYHQGQQTEALSRDAQDGPTAGSSHGVQEHAGVSTYSSSTDSYAYQGYYYGYQPQTNNTYSQQVGAYQSSGAPYQPLSSFQNSGAYAGSTSYSSTYFNTADYQTTGVYPSGSNNNQTTTWSNGSYANYPSQQYSNYGSLDSNSAHSSSGVAAAPLSYEQQYKQWADYYSQTASDVSCAPGTEKMSTISALTKNCQISTTDGGYPLDSQPPPPGTTSWRQEPSSSDFSSSQVWSFNL